jgi:hypothetical protein
MILGTGTSNPSSDLSFDTKVAVTGMRKSDPKPPYSFPLKPPGQMKTIVKTFSHTCTHGYKAAS